MSNNASQSELAAALREAGVGRLSDSLILPIADRGPRYAASCRVRFHGRYIRMWIRVADVPFDVLPATMRPLTPSRSGSFFTLGPGFTSTGDEHPAVLHLQIEGSQAEVDERAAAVRPLINELSEIRQVRLSTHPERWNRMCVAALAQG